MCDGHHRGGGRVVNPVQQMPPPMAAPSVTWSGPRPAVRHRDIAAEASHLKLDKPAAVRLHLQRRAPVNLRSHVRRGALRLAVLVAADMLAFGVMRELVRAVRDRQMLGSAVARGMQAAFPSGTLNGWQFAVALFVGLLVAGSYGQGDKRRDSARLFAACALATALPLWTMLFTRGVQPVLLQYAATVVLVWLCLLGERLTINRIEARVRPPERDAVDTLFVGPAGDCLEAASSPAFETGTDYRPIGFVDVQIPPAPGALGHVSDIPLLLAASGAQVVTLCGYLTDKQLQDVVDSALAGGCQVLAVPRVVDIAGVHPTTVWRGGQPLVQLTAPSLHGQQLAVKRTLDVVGAAAGLLLLAPVMLLLGLAVKIDSPGPVFFAQNRAGFGGRRFRMWKFRTMRDGADHEKQAMAHLNHTGDKRLFKIPNDPRVTRLGKLLRRWSLDELPQLWNVLVGEMSLVGPRPFFESDLADYEDRHFRRLGVKPGITGLWQVSGRSDAVDFEEVVRLDSEYIRNWSLLFDL